jgi:hypothetical protein
MNIFKRRIGVQQAQARVHAARNELGVPVSALLSRGRDHPLTTVGTASVAGFVLGRLNVHPLRIPGLRALLGGGLAEAVAYGARLVAEFSEIRGGTDRHANAATEQQPDLFDRPGREPVAP